MTKSITPRSPIAHPQDDLVRLARAGDSRALDRLLRQNAESIRRICHRVGRDLPDIDDLYQDTLLAVTRYVRKYRGDAAFLTWVFTVARSCANRTRARLGRARLLSDGIVGERVGMDPALDDAVAASELRSVIAAAVDALGPLDREVLVLRDVEGYAAAEVAQALGLTVSAVKSRLHRGRAAVRTAVTGKLAIEPAEPMVAAPPLSRHFPAPAAPVSVFSTPVSGGAAVGGTRQRRRPPSGTAAPA